MNINLNGGAIMNLYDRIRQLRESLGMTQEQLAQKTGYKSRSAINKIEKGLRDINQSQIKAFADALQTTPAYLMGWDEPISDSEFKEMMAFLNPYWVGVKYVEDRDLGEQYEIITYKDDEYGEIANELFEKYSEIKGLNEDDVAYEISKFFSKKKNYSKITRLEKYDKEHKEEIEKLSKEVEDIENSSDLVKRIKILLAIQGKTISNLEEEAGFKEGTIEKWNRNLPITPKIQKVADILNTSLNYLISGDDENQENILFVARKAQDLNPKNLELIKMTIKTLLESQGE